MEDKLLEILNYLKRLEEKVDMLLSKNYDEKKATMSEIRDFITNLKNIAKSENKESIIIIANDVHASMKLKNRMPMVCNAMYQSMKTGDEVLFATKSGHSSTLKIKYYLK